MNVARRKRNLDERDPFTTADEKPRRISARAVITACGLIKACCPCLESKGRLMRAPPCRRLASIRSLFSAFVSFACCAFRRLSLAISPQVVKLPLGGPSLVGVGLRAQWPSKSFSCWLFSTGLGVTGT
jgi:hypothetical protein